MIILNEQQPYKLHLKQFSSLPENLELVFAVQLAIDQPHLRFPPQQNLLFHSVLQQKPSPRKMHPKQLYCHFHLFQQLNSNYTKTTVESQEDRSQSVLCVGGGGGVVGVGTL